MRNSKHRLTSLHDIQHIRSIKVRLAEISVAKAQQDLRLCEAETHRQGEALNKAFADWQSILSTSTFNPISAMAWGQQVNLHVEKLSEQQKNEELSREKVSEVQKYLAEAKASEECSNTLLTKAKRSFGLHLENRMIAEREDEVLRIRI